MRAIQLNRREGTSTTANIIYTGSTAHYISLTIPKQMGRFIHNCTKCVLALLKTILYKELHKNIHMNRIQLAISQDM